MAAETGNANIFRTITDKMEIITANLRIWGFEHGELAKSLSKQLRH